MTNRVGRWALTVVSIAVVAGAAFWAGRTTLQPTAPVVSESAAPVVTTVIESSVGRSLTLNASVDQDTALIAANPRPGTVTEVRPVGDVSEGDPLYAIDGVPVRAVEGSTPFYRDLALGATGTDVRQLQDALRRMGYLTRPSDGRFGPATAAALGHWQKQLGAAVTGSLGWGRKPKRMTG